MVYASGVYILSLLKRFYSHDLYLIQSYQLSPQDLWQGHNLGSKRAWASTASVSKLWQDTVVQKGKQMDRVIPIPPPTFFMHKYGYTLYTNQNEYCIDGYVYIQMRLFPAKTPLPYCRELWTGLQQWCPDGADSWPVLLTWYMYICIISFVTWKHPHRSKCTCIFKIKWSITHHQKLNKL